jgi:hypothetical protein
MRKRTFIGITAGILSLVSVQGSVPPETPLALLGETIINSDDPLFWGISAIDISDDGLRLLAISDNGSYTHGVITRDAFGRVESVAFDPMQRLKTFRGSQYLSQKDTEGVAVGPDGTIFVSFELYALIAAFPTIDDFPVKLPSPPEFADYMNNRSLESLAIDRAGVIYSIPEAPAASATEFPVFRFDGTHWDHDLRLPRRGGYLAVSADFGPDDRFYLLERLYYGFPAFSSRLRRFDLTDQGFVNEVTLFTSTIGTHENLEALSVWRNPAGRLVATMMADDNFNALFSTQLDEYVLPD